MKGKGNRKYLKASMFTYTVATWNQNKTLLISSVNDKWEY